MEFVEKLNKLPSGVHIVEERKTLESGVWEGYLDHDNANHKSLQIWTGPRFTGGKVENYFLSTSADMPWKTYLKVFSSTVEVYVTYETSGDQVEAEDINLLQKALVVESERAIGREDEIEDKLGVEIQEVKDALEEISDLGPVTWDALRGQHE